MKTKKKHLHGKLLAVIFAFVVAIGVLSGGVLSVSAHADEHKHTFAETWTAGYKNHWHASTCGCTGLVADMAPHTFENGKCTVCNEDKVEIPHVHTFEEKWTYDGANHWHASTCGDKIVKDIAPHTGSDCTVCGYKTGGTTGPDPVDPGTDPVTPPGTDPGDNPGIGDIDDPQKPAEVPQGINEAAGYNEGLYAEWTSNSVTGVTASYKKQGASDWVNIDKNLIRVSGNTARLDAVGLSKGVYDLKVTFADGEKTVSNIEVGEYDRSGYAHFNRPSDDPSYTGVGAYKDDGTLKDGALVIYVSNSNKNDVSDYVYKNTANGLVKEDITQYIKPGKPSLNNKDLGGETYGSIGYILNNRGYANNTERANYGIQKLTQVYGAVAVRILDKVDSAYDSSLYGGDAPTLTGLTYYAKSGSTNPITGEKYAKGVTVPNGGTVNDNGQMARITNAKNLTIEGIGEDAVIDGWGVHFVSNDNLPWSQGKKTEAGKSFEVRNITFQNYPEDAIGMEGTQGTKVDATGSITGGASDAGADLISPVERCWIHNNVFLPGFCAKPAESDKAEGDGSCDFKRGQFYTLSYNYFTDCHKTNLIGSSDSSVTYNITMHHNWWHNCGSRQPLARQANIHYYNNYITGATDYVSSLRANCLIFSEANYYEGCKQITQKKDGNGVAWQNVYYANYNTNDYVELTSRTQTVSNSCKFQYRNIDYSSFYVNPDVFYYDTVNKTSDCKLDNAITARVKVMMNSGVIGFGVSRGETAMNEYTPSKAVEIADSGDTVIALPTSKGDVEVNGVMFRGLTGTASGTVKGKGQIITFTLASEAELTVTTTTSGDTAPELVGADGYVWAGKFTGTLKIVLPAGTYFIGTGQKDKESVISAMSFADTGNSKEARKQAAIDAINAIPATVTAADKDTVNSALAAYNALTASERSELDGALVKKLTDAVVAYNGAIATEVVGLIDQIGTVTADSYEKINAAQKAYDGLTKEQKALVTNYDKLVAAQTAFNVFAVDNLAKFIEELPDVSAINITDENAINAAVEKYNDAYAIYADFGEVQKENMDTNHAAAVKKLTDGLAALKPLPNLFTFKNALAEIEDASKVTLSEGNAVIALYNVLTAEQKNALTDAEKAKLAEIKEVVEDLASHSEALSFTSNTPGYNNSFFTVSGNTTSGNVTVDGVTYTTGLKMESSTSVKFTTSVDMTLTMYFGGSGTKVKVDGTSYTVQSGVVTVKLTAGSHTITKDTTNTYLFLLTLSPAA